MRYSLPLALVLFLLLLIPASAQYNYCSGWVSTGGYFGCLSYGSGDTADTYDTLAVGPDAGPTTSSARSSPALSWSSDALGVYVRARPVLDISPAVPPGGSTCAGAACDLTVYLWGYVPAGGGGGIGPLGGYYCPIVSGSIGGEVVFYCAFEDDAFSEFSGSSAPSGFTYLDISLSVSGSPTSGSAAYVLDYPFLHTAAPTPLPTVTPTYTPTVTPSPTLTPGPGQGSCGAWSARSPGIVVWRESSLIYPSVSFADCALPPAAAREWAIPAPSYVNGAATSADTVRLAANLGALPEGYDEVRFWARAPQGVGADIFTLCSGCTLEFSYSVGLGGGETSCGAPIQPPAEFVDGFACSLALVTPGTPITVYAELVGGSGGGYMIDADFDVQAGGGGPEPTPVSQTDCFTMNSTYMSSLPYQNEHGKSHGSIIVFDPGYHGYSEYHLNPSFNGWWVTATDSPILYFNSPTVGAFRVPVGTAWYIPEDSSQLIIVDEYSSSPYEATFCPAQYMPTPTPTPSPTVTPVGPWQSGCFAMESFDDGGEQNLSPVEGNFLNWTYRATFLTTEYYFAYGNGGSYYADPVRGDTATYLIASNTTYISGGNPEGDAFTLEICPPGYTTPTPTPTATPTATPNATATAIREATVTAQHSTATAQAATATALAFTPSPVPSATPCYFCPTPTSTPAPVPTVPLSPTPPTGDLGVPDRLELLDQALQERFPFSVVSQLDDVLTGLLATPTPGGVASTGQLQVPMLLPGSYAAPGIGTPVAYITPVGGVGAPIAYGGQAVPEMAVSTLSIDLEPVGRLSRPISALLFVLGFMWYVVQRVRSLLGVSGAGGFSKKPGEDES